MRWEVDLLVGEERAGDVLWAGVVAAGGGVGILRGGSGGVGEGGVGGGSWGSAELFEEVSVPGGVEVDVGVGGVAGHGGVNDETSRCSLRRVQKFGRSHRQ